MKQYFGTDGIRGIANKDLTVEIVFQLAKIFGYMLIRDNGDGGRKRVLIGKDTRISCGMLEAALTAGFASQGLDVVQAGIIPTPGLAYATKVHDFAAGVMISASHNPAEENGIKLFNRNGFKLSDETERQIEALMESTDERSFRILTGKDVGTVCQDKTLSGIYLEYLKRIEHYSLSGLKIVVDTANGATYQLAEPLFRSLGAEIILIFNSPNGLNINYECGSTHISNLQEAVMKHHANLGLAFDGDGDRLLAVDEGGKVVDGDQILLITTLELHRENRLRENLVVSTIMSNHGLEEALERNHITLKRTSVGDRYVLEEMLKTGAVLGGEQSGHTIFLDHSTTGDGLVTAIKLLTALQKSGTALSTLAGQMIRYPQILLNVNAARRVNLTDRPAIQSAIRKAEKELDGNGRIIVRPSGTEPLVRLMVEGKDHSQIRKIADELAAVIRRELG